MTASKCATSALISIFLAFGFSSCFKGDSTAFGAPAWNYVPEDDIYFIALKQEQEKQILITQNEEPQKPGDSHKKLRFDYENLPKNADNNGSGEVVRIYYANGELAWEIHFLGGKQHGYTKHFYNNGQLAAELNFNNGKAHGELAQYYFYGTLKSKEHYENDYLAGVASFYNTLGELKKTVYYENGEEMGEEIHNIASL